MASRLEDYISHVGHAFAQEGMSPPRGHAGAGVAATEWLEDYIAHGPTPERMAALHARPPQYTDETPTLVGAGAMQLGKEGTPLQNPSTYGTWVATFSEIVERFRKHRKIGEKHDALCITMGHPKIFGSATEQDCAGVQFGILDLDEQMDDARVELLKRFFAPWGYFLFTSASHNPKGKGAEKKYKVKIMFQFDTMVSYQVSAALMEGLAREVAGYLGIDQVLYPKAIDMCCMRAMQPQLIPAHKSQAIRDQAWDHYQPGPSMRIAERAKHAQALVVEKLAAAAAARENQKKRFAEKKSRMGSQMHGAVSQKDIFSPSGEINWKALADTRGVDRLARACADIDSLNLRPGCGRSNDGLFRAACICQEWGLDEGEALDAMTTCFGGTYEDQRLHTKVRSCYGKTNKTNEGRALECAIGAQEFELEDAVGIVGGVGIVGVVTDHVGDAGFEGNVRFISLGNPEEVGATAPVSSWVLTEESKILARHGADCAGAGFELFDLAEPPAFIHGAQIDFDHAPNEVENEHFDDGSTSEEENCQIEHAPGRSTVERINQPRLTPIEAVGSLATKVLYIQSPTGTGKNYSLRPLFEDLQKRGLRGLGVVHRQSLAWSLHSSYPSLACYLDPGLDTSNGIEGSSVVCLDSLEKVRIFSMEGDCDPRKISVVVLDEVEQLARHMVGATLGKRGKIARVYQKLRRILQAADHIICQDADLSPLSLRFIRDLLEWSDPSQFDEHTIVNKWRDTDREAAVYASEFQLLLELLEAGKTRKVWCYGTSRSAVAAAHLAYCRTHPGKKAILLDRYTTATPEAAQLLSQKTPEAAQLAWAAYDAVFCTGTVGTGVSVEVPFQVFGFCGSGCGPIAQDVKQGLARVRDPIDRKIHIYVGGKTRYAETNGEVVRRNLRISSKASLAFLAKKDLGWETYVEREEDLDVSYIDPTEPEIAALACDVEAQRAKWGNHFADAVIKDKNGNPKGIKRGPLLQHMEKCGYQMARAPVLPAITLKEFKRHMRAFRLKTKITKATRAAKAPLHSKKSAHDAYEMQGTPEAEAILTKADIADFHARADVTVEQILQDEEGNYRTACRRFSALQAWQEGLRAPVVALDAPSASVGLSSELTLHAQETELLWILLRAFGISNLLGDALAHTVIHIDPSKLDHIFKHKDMIKRVLKITVGPKTGYAKKPITLCQALLARVGIKTIPHRTHNARTHTLNQDTVRTVWADADAYIGKMTTPALRTIPVPEIDFMQSMDDIAAGILDKGIDNVPDVQDVLDILQKEHSHVPS